MRAKLIHIRRLGRLLTGDITNTLSVGLEGERFDKQI